MSEFDDMLKAGVISPGSTPFVEGKRAPARDHLEISAQVTIVTEERTSVVTRSAPPEADGAGRVRVAPLQPAAVTGLPHLQGLVCCSSAERSNAVVAALEGVCTLAAVPSSAIQFAAVMKFGLAIVDRGFDDLERLQAFVRAVVVLDPEQPPPGRQTLVEAIRASLAAVFVQPPRPRVLICSPKHVFAVQLSFDLALVADCVRSGYLPTLDDPQLVGARALIVDASYPDLANVMTLGLPTVLITGRASRARAAELAAAYGLMVLPAHPTRDEALRALASALKA